MVLVLSFNGVLIALLVSMFVVSFPFSPPVRSVSSHHRPGVGLRQSVKLCGILVWRFGLPVALIWSLVLGLPGLLSGFLMAAALAHLYCGRGLMSYWITRALLAWAGILPMRLVRSLDLAVDRILMVRVGGGYAFTHRLLLEYLAALDDSLWRPIGGLPPIDLRARDGQNI
jgi:hypothetical protein